MHHVAHRPGALIMDGEPNGQTDMKGDKRHECQPRGPQRHRHLPQERRIGVQRIGPLENLEVSEHMEDDEHGERQPREGNENLAAEGGEDVAEESDHGQGRRTASFTNTPLS